MGRCVLPYETDVESRAFQNQAFAMTVLKPNLKKYDCWLCNRCINFTRSKDTFCVHDTDVWSREEGLVTREEIITTPKFFEDDGSGFINQNRKALEEHSYINGTFDEYYIPGKHAYGNEYHRHGYLIVGYDDEREEFYSVGYRANGRYEFFPIRYQDYAKSVLYNTNYHYYIKLDTGFKPEVRLEHLKKELNNYLQSRSDKYGRDSGRLFGLESMDSFYEYVSTREYLDLRNGRSYMEHKKLMYKRIKYLWEHSYLTDDCICQQYQKEVSAKAEIVFMLFLKYRLTRNREILKHISSLVKQINEWDRKLIEKVLFLVG